MEPTEMPPPQQLMTLLNGYQLSQAAYVVAKLEVADQLLDGPRPVEEVAQAVGARPDMLYRLLRTLSSVGVFHEVEARTFALTPVGTLLARGAAGSIRDLALFGVETHYEPFGHLLHTVTTGENAMQYLYGDNLFGWLEKHPDHAARFTGAMANLNQMMKAGAAGVYDFTLADTIVDVGGSDGALLTHVLGLAPEARGILFDLPHVVGFAGKALQASGLADRVDVVGGSFFEGVPGGADLYLLSQILHDWSDGECATILANIRRVIPPDGRVVAIDFVVPSGDTPHLSKTIDLAMMATHTGRERTEPEWRSLFEQSDFELTRIIASPTPISVIEAVPR